MTNLTLVVDDEVLRRARIRALEEGTSVNAEVRTFLTRYAAGGTGLTAFLADSEDVDASSGRSGRQWQREDLHREDRRRAAPAPGPSAGTPPTPRRRTTG